MGDAAFKKVHKAFRTIHKERAQDPEHAKALGFMEKKKDYQVRAKLSSKRKEVLDKLAKLAEGKNPDEFQYGMVRRKMAGGYHVLKARDDLLVAKSKKGNAEADQLRIAAASMDTKYLNYISSVEQKKLEKMQASLHHLGAYDDDNIQSTHKPTKRGIQNTKKHTIFVDSKQGALQFDPAAYFDTHPALVGRTHNRPTMKALAEESLVQASSSELRAIERTQKKAYARLAAEIEKVDKVKAACNEVATRNQLLSKHPKHLVGKDTDGNDLYRWRSMRSR